MADGSGGLSKQGVIHDRENNYDLVDRFSSNSSVAANFYCRISSEYILSSYRYKLLGNPFCNISSQLIVWMYCGLLFFIIW